MSDHGLAGGADEQLAAVSIPAVSPWFVTGLSVAGLYPVPLTCL